MVLLITLTLFFNLNQNLLSRNTKRPESAFRNRMNLLQFFKKPSELKNWLKKTHYSQNLLLEEFPFDTTRFLGPAPGTQDFSDVAFDGVNYFIVWEDGREDWYYQIYGARVTPTGVLLDTFGILISGGEGYRFCPAISYDGTNYFVVWMDDRDGDWYFEIYGARVRRDGTVIDTLGIPISVGFGDRFYPSITFDGTNYLVAWSDDRDGDQYYDIYGCRVTQEGQVLEPEGIPICTADYNQVIFRGITFGGENYFLAWSDDRDGDWYYDVYGARVSRAGVVLDPMGIPISQAENNQLLPRLSFYENNYSIVWMDDREMEEDWRVYFARVRSDGVVIDTQGIRLTDEFSYYPSINFDGTNYLITYTIGEWFERDIYGMRIRPDGVVIDTNGFIISQAIDEQFLPAIIFGAGKYFVSWTDWRNYDGDLYGARITTDGTVLDPDGILLTYGLISYTQWNPACAFDGNNYLVVWVDYRNENLDIYGTRLTPAGVILDPLGIPICINEAGQWSPEVSFDGNNFLVVWQDYRNGEGDIYGCRITREGVVLDTQGIQISQLEYDDYYPSVAFDDTNYLVVYQWYDWVNEKYGIYGARVSTAGSVLDNFPIATSEYWQGYPSVTFGQENYLVTFEDDQDGDWYLDINGARVTREGVVLDTSIPISIADENQYYPSVSFDGNNYFVVWQDYRNYEADIYGTRVSPQGTVLEPDGIPISTAYDWQEKPSITFDGIQYFVIWSDWRSMENIDIYGARVLPSGVLIDTNGIELINATHSRYYPKVTKGPISPERQLLLTFNGYYPPLGEYKALGAFYHGAVGIKEVSIKRQDLNLRIFPNPILKEGFIEFVTPREMNVKVELYDVSGRFVAQLFNQRLKAGKHTFSFSAKDFKKGVYFIKLATNEKSLIKKIIIM